MYRFCHELCISHEAFPNRTYRYRDRFAFAAFISPRNYHSSSARTYLDNRIAVSSPR